MNSCQKIIIRIPFQYQPFPGLKSLHQAVPMLQEEEGCLMEYFMIYDMTTSYFTIAL